MIFPLVFLSLGVLYAVLACYLKMAAGPYWLHPNFDPAYVYLISGLQVLVQELPGQYEHPGTPLQITIALVVSLMNISKDLETMVINVLQDPEKYLNASWVVLSCLVIFSTVKLALYAYRSTRDVIFCLCLFLPSFIFLTFKSRESVDAVLTIASNVSPEHCFIALCNFYVIYALFFLSRKGIGHERQAGFWGCLCGISLMTKLTFFPLLLLPCTLLRTWRERGYFAGAFIITAVLSTVPLLPIYPEVLHWFEALGGHSGWYGHGDNGLINWAVYLPNMSMMIKENFFLVILMAMASAFVFFQKQVEEADSVFLVRRRAWGCFVAIWMIYFFIIPKMPSSHYMVPAYGITGLFLGLAYRHFRRSSFRMIFAGLIVSMLVVLPMKSFAYARALRQKMRRIQGFSRRVYKEHPESLIIGYYRNSSVADALFFGDSWYFRNTFAPYLEKLYPNSYFYDEWRGYISNFTVFIPIAELRRKYPSILLFGNHEGYWESDTMTEIEEQDGTRLYLVNTPP